jgi:hypothetical protein
MPSAALELRFCLLNQLVTIVRTPTIVTVTFSNHRLLAYLGNVNALEIL